MKPAKLRQIHRIRAQVALLRQEAHVRRCLCCRSDCDALEEAADSPHAEVFLVRIVRRCHEAGMRAREINPTGEWPRPRTDEKDPG